jgi:hypothetical protein
VLGVVERSHAEVDDLHALRPALLLRDQWVLRKHDILGLHVAVHYGIVVHVRNRVGKLSKTPSSQPQRASTQEW